MAEFEIRDNDTGKTYTVKTSTLDSSGCSGIGKITIAIAYIFLLIGLTLGTISVAEAFPAMLFIPILLDIFALMPLFSYFIYFFKHKPDEEWKKSLQKGKNTNYDSGSVEITAGYTLSIWKYMLQFLGKFGYILFYGAIVTYWTLYFCGINNTLSLSLMFLCMYGMYYFPYLMFRRAKICNSRFASIMGLASIYAGVIAVCVGMTVGSEAFASTAPVLLPTVMGIFAIFCLPIQAKAYDKYGEGKGPLSLKTIFIILGVSLLVLAFVFSIISGSMKSN